MPAKIFGPVVNITLSLGNCTVVHDSEDDPKGKSIECTGPRLSYKKVQCRQPDLTAWWNLPGMLQP